MKKTLLSLTTIGLFSMVFVAVAANEGGNPFDAVWQKLIDLQDQINNIELTPGPEGPQGEKGDKGDTGEQGAPGPQGQAGINCWDLNGNGIGDLNEDSNGDGNYDALDCKGEKGDQGEQGLKGDSGNPGQNLVVVDKDGIVRGLFLGIPYEPASPQSFQVWLYDYKAAAWFYPTGHFYRSVPYDKIGYSGPGCSGQAYSVNRESLFSVLNTPNESYAAESEDKYNVTADSSRGVNGFCYETNESLRGAYKLIEVDSNMLTGGYTIEQR